MTNPATGQRDQTAVLGFSCTAGPGQETYLHMDDVVVSCSGNGGATFTVDVAAAPGQQNPDFSAPTGGKLLFQSGVYRGDEQLPGYAKGYWNVALGLNAGAFATLSPCTLTATASASDAPFSAGQTPDGVRWPVITWDVPLTVAPGTLACTAHAIGDDNGVAAGYTTTAGHRFKASRHVGESAVTLAEVNPVANGPSIGWSDGTYATSCDGYRHPTAAPYTWTDTGDGVYTVDPDGAGGAAPFDVYCDMTTDGGGWTLVMRFAGSASTFTFNSPYWTDANLLNETSLDPAVLGSDAKYGGYMGVVGGELRGCLRHPTTGAYGCKVYALPVSQTAHDLFTNTPIGSDTADSGGLYFTETDAERYQWLTLQGRSTADFSSPPPIGYVRTGINIDDDMSCFDARIRFGLALNNETDIYTLNDTAGFGASAYYTLACDLASTVDPPWSVGSGMAAASNEYATAGHIWMR